MIPRANIPLVSQSQSATLIVTLLVTVVVLTYHGLTLHLSKFIADPPPPLSPASQQPIMQEQTQQYWTQQETDTNSALANTLRDEVVQACHSGNISSLRSSLDGLVVPHNTSTQVVRERNESDMTCPMLFLDLGANIGDSLGKFIDAGIPECNDLIAASESARWNRTTGQIGIVSVAQERQYRKNNALVTWTRQRLERISTEFVRSVFPEEYCYVGVEGNPLFSQQLQQMQARTMASRPRPVRAAHFYTETVATNVNGPTVLYLDTVNSIHNFWGSSVLRTHADVQKSARKNGGVEAGAAVTGVTLTELLQRHVLVSPSQKSHVLIKIDIEGAEFAVLNEAFDSGYLCHLASSGVIIDMLLEVHSQIGPSKDQERFESEVRVGLQRCGIAINKGSAGR